MSHVPHYPGHREFAVEAEKVVDRDALRGRLPRQQRRTRMPTRYRKRPVTVEAIQFTSNDAAAEIYEWAGQPPIRLGIDPATGRCDYVLIDTLEGTMRADPGDWVIRGVAGEFYPCKPDVFARTYDEDVNPATQTVNRA